MKSLFLFLLLLPCFLFAAGNDVDTPQGCDFGCYLNPQVGVENTWIIECDWRNCEYPPPGPEDTMSQEACSNLVSQINELLERLESDLNDIDNDVGDVDSSLQIIKNNLEAYQDYVLEHIDDPDAYQQVIGIWGLFLENIASNRMQIAETRGKIDMMLGDVYSAKNSVGNYDCRGTCSSSSGGGSSGSATCPCQSELSDIVNLINTGNETRDRLEVIQDELRAELKLLRGTATNILDSVDFIRKRYEAPDDRMWSEIEDIYRSTFASNGVLHNSSLYLEGIFYNIRDLIQGTVGEPLNFSTEGVVGLNSLVFQMGQYAIGRSLSLQMDYMLDTLTNVFSRFYREFNLAEVHYTTRSWIPSVNRPYVYLAMTNDALSLVERFSYLANPDRGGVTNWFKRMELYQQAALGWFDTPLDNPLEYKQDEVEENTIEYAFENQTNKLGKVVSGLHDATSGVSVLVKEVSDGLRELRINVRLPSEVILIDTIDLGIVDFPAVVFETGGGFYEFFEVCRSSTSLFWRLGIWVLYFFLAYAVIRVATQCVLYAVKFFRDL